MDPLFFSSRNDAFRSLQMMVRHSRQDDCTGLRREEIARTLDTDYIAGAEVEYQDNGGVATGWSHGMGPEMKSLIVWKGQKKVNESPPSTISLSKIKEIKGYDAIKMQETFAQCAVDSAKGSIISAEETRFSQFLDVANELFDDLPDETKQGIKENSKKMEVLVDVWKSKDGTKVDRRREFMNIVDELFMNLPNDVKEDFKKSPGFDIYGHVYLDLFPRGEA